MIRPDPGGAGGIGLALSGGGLRAAFFHVGVLERLAQRQLLGHVRVLSCVSGGSIAGSVYYLSLVRQLMVTDRIEPGSCPTLRTAELEPHEYVRCVEMTRAVLTAMARSNIRAAVFRNPWKNLVMFLSPRYSRTDRAGDMLDTRLRKGFSIDTGRNKFGVANQIELRSLDLHRTDLPRLVLNATTLNTGHSWRFETGGMGERFPDERRQVDKNDKLVWAPIASLPKEQQNFPLALAVAASAAFPGLFRPLPIGDIYGRRVDLMDGGAQDNQGIQGLMDEPEKCPFELVIVSDGAGQLENQGTTSRSVIQIGRIIGIQGDRIREEQLLTASKLIKAAGSTYVLLDLRDDLPYADVPVKGSVSTPTGVRERLARIRTDLDAFGSLETTLLARRGYEIAAKKLGGKRVTGIPTIPEVAGSSFNDRLLSAAAAQMLKPVRVFSPLHLVVIVALVLAVPVAMISSLRYLGPDQPNRRLLVLLLLLVYFVAPIVLGRLLLRLTRRWRPGRIRKVIGGGVMYAALGALAWGLGPSVVGWLDVSASRKETLVAAAMLLVGPAVLPFVLSLLLFAEGMVWKRLASLEPD